MKLVFATNNQHKLREISQIVGNDFKILSLSDINCFDDIPEEQDTIEGNASQKSFYVFEKFGVDCFADDTGLEVEALNGAPGVYSARYAGKECIAENNIEKLLHNLENQSNRKARFKTVISLIINKKEYLFEGLVNGIILTQKRGNGGFGYDPVFVPDGHTQTFAEMSAETKNNISHRALAVNKLGDFLAKYTFE